MRRYQKFLVGLGSILAIGAIVTGTSIGLTNSLNYTISSESNNNAANDLSSWTTTFNNYAKNHYQNLVKTDLNYYCQNASTYLENNLKATNTVTGNSLMTIYMFTNDGNATYSEVQSLLNDSVSLSNLTFNKNNSSFNVDLNILLDVNCSIFNSNSSSSEPVTTQNIYQIQLSLQDATIAPTIIDNMNNLINQKNQTITPSGGWYINHIGYLNWSESLGYWDNATWKTHEETYEQDNSNYYDEDNPYNDYQIILNKLTNNQFGNDVENSISSTQSSIYGNTFAQSGDESNINFSNPSNSDYVSCVHTGLLNAINLYNLNFNQNYSLKCPFENYQTANGNNTSTIFSLQKATPFMSQNGVGYWIENVFNGAIASYDVAVNSNKLSQLNSVTNYDLYAINTSGRELVYLCAYVSNSQQY